MTGGDLSRITSALVYQGLLKGDRLSRRIMEKTGRYLGVSVASLVNIFNPEIVIFSGGVARAGRWLFEPIRREVALRAFPVPVKRVRIVPARLGDDAGVIGAAGIALERLKD
jgi:glucokinase